MSLAKYRIDPVKETDGVWHDLGDGMQVKIARFGNSNYVKLKAALEKPFQDRFRRGKDLTDEQKTEQMNRLVSETIITDWKGIIDPDTGKAVPYAKAITIISNPEYHDFADDIVSRSLKIEHYYKEAKEEAAKN